MLGNTAYHLAIARAPGGLGWLYWLVLHAAQGHGLCIKCIMKSNIDMRPEEESRAGSGDVLSLLAHRIPRHSHSALANQMGIWMVYMKGLLNVSVWPEGLKAA